ncbi:MAG TPA: LuxR C-terminal-related transcriptional regulator [Gaiellaceae bacterium]|jgi:DNA-binding NarL/FixJ family response regulator
MRTGLPSALRLLLVTQREPVASFFRNLPRVRTTLVAVPDEATLDATDVVVVDVALDPEGATRLCQELRVGRPHLPIVVLLCCPQSVDPWQLQGLLGAGVGGVLDLQLSADEAVRTLEATARGGFVLHLHLRRGQRSLLRRALAGADARRETKLRVLELVARGYPDREIGAALHLSPHTVKHHVEDLRAEVGVRNRTELAAWAGRQGFYRPDADEAIPVRLARRSER